jgi:hypothetical protein
MRKLEPAQRIALTELRAMTPFFLICDGVIALICIILAVFGEGFGYNLFTGLLFGNIAAVFNFYFMAFAAGRLTMRGERKNPRRLMGLSYGARIIILFIVYYVLMTLGVIHPVTAVIPLLYPSFYYKTKAIFNKSV